jgi:hypothetical protein
MIFLDGQCLDVFPPYFRDLAHNIIPPQHTNVKSNTQLRFSILEVKLCELKIWCTAAENRGVRFFAQIALSAV